MKKILTMLLMLVSFTTIAQKKEISEKVGLIVVPQNKTFNLDKPKDEGELTNNIAYYKGVRYPVYATRAGRLFIKTISPTTLKEGRKYIPQSLI